MTTAAVEAKQQGHAAPPGVALSAAAAAAAPCGGVAATATTSASFVPPLEAQLSASRASLLHPQAFFVSWQGVLTLAYSGFTGALLDLKQRVSAAHPMLPPENPGSKWPKTSIGCLRDGRRLTPEQLAALCRICSEESAAFQQEQHAGTSNGAAAAAAGCPAVAVDSACVALFECRSLERLLSCRHIDFQGGLDASPPTAEERQRVATILAEPSSPTYWFEASRDGNREAHYRGPHLGATLMHPLLPAEGHSACTDGAPPAAAAAAAAAVATRHGAAAASGSRGGTADRQALVAAIDQFRRRVDAELPGLYVWFSDASLHITLRALIN